METAQNKQPDINLSVKTYKTSGKKRYTKEEQMVRYVIFAIATAVWGAIGYLSVIGSMVVYERYLMYAKVTHTSNQLSSLIDNIRNAYMADKLFKVGTIQDLEKRKIIPEGMLANDKKTLVNPYGGKIIIKPSYELVNNIEHVTSPTFKISYQNLPHDACVFLTTMDWGSKNEGLLAIATGVIDYRTKADTALNNIDKNKDTANESTGRKPRRSSEKNVARPNDATLPTPVNKNMAEYLCRCSSSNICTFAVHYTVYDIDKVVRY